MSELVLDQGRRDVSGYTSAALRKELAEQLTLTAKSLYRAAEIWQELRRRGEEPTGLRSGVALYLPRVARGELAAEAVIAFAGQRVLLQRMVGMPLEEQRAYADGKPVTVAEQNDEGLVVPAERRLADMTSRQVELSIDDGKVRHFEVQRRTIERALERPTKKRLRTGSTAKVRADVHSGTVVVGRVRIEPYDLTAALAALGFSLVRKVPDGGNSS